MNPALWIRPPTHGPSGNVLVDAGEPSGVLTHFRVSKLKEHYRRLHKCAATTRAGRPCNLPVQHHGAYCRRHGGGKGKQLWLVNEARAKADMRLAANRVQTIWKRRKTQPGAAAWAWYPGETIQLDAESEAELQAVLLRVLGPGPYPAAHLDWARWQHRQVVTEGRVTRMAAKLGVTADLPGFVTLMQVELVKRVQKAGSATAAQIEKLVEIQALLDLVGGELRTYRYSGIDQLYRDARNAI